MAEATVVVCAHNEQAYIVECLKGILNQTTPPLRVVLIADRCTDKTVELSERLLPRGSLVIEKERAEWRSSYAENLEIGRQKATGQFLAIIDADILVPPTFLEKLLGEIHGEVNASTSALVKTDPRKGWLNRLVSRWERTYLFTPFGREPRGGARAISLKALEEVGGFRDVMAPDTDLDSRLRERSMKVAMDTNVVALHLRRMTVKRSIRYQIEAGKARRELGLSPSRTLLHSLGRLRPFVIYGYLKAPRSMVSEGTQTP